MTFGYLTARTRKKYNIEKSHHADARCISGNPTAEPSDTWYQMKKVRCHNRQIHKFNPKHGKRRLNQAPYEVYGFHLFDKVRYKDQECFIFGRRSMRRMDIRLLDGTKVNTSVGYKNIKLIEFHKSYLIERKTALLTMISHSVSEPK